MLAAVGDGPAPPQAPRPAPELLAASGADVLVELTVMGDLSGVAAGAAAYRPAATDHVLEAFRLGMDVVTANKGPIAWSWPEVSAAAAASGRRIRFESTVMDGLPVFSLLEYTLPDCALLGFEAVFNATTNFIIDAMGTGRSFDDALAQVQAEGYAEADPGNDVDGWDAASKAAALANVAMGAGITPADVERESLRDVPLERIVRAREQGRRLRLVSSVWREPAGPPAARRPARSAPACAPRSSTSSTRWPPSAASRSGRCSTPTSWPTCWSASGTRWCRRRPTACTRTCCTCAGRADSAGRPRRADAPRGAAAASRPPPAAGRRPAAAPALLAARAARLARRRRRRRRARRRRLPRRALALPSGRRRSSGPATAGASPPATAASSAAWG